MFEGDDHVASVVSGVTYSVLGQAGLSEQRGDELVEAIRQHAPPEIERLHRTGGLEEQPQVDADTYVVDLNSYNIDTAQLRADN